MAGKVMTKSQLVGLLAEKMGVTKAVATGMLETLAAAALSETKKNGQFVLPGIGKLVKSQRKARMGRNPQTGESIKIPAKTVVKFRRGQGRQGSGRTSEEVVLIRSGRRTEPGADGFGPFRIQRPWRTLPAIQFLDVSAR